MRQASELQGLAVQAAEHVAIVRGLLVENASPDLGALRQAVAATRALRGNASLLGLDPLQAFLGRLFQLLEDVETGSTPWSGRVETVLREALEAESRFVEGLERGDPNPEVGLLVEADTKLAAWRRTANGEPAPSSINPDPVTSSESVPASVDLRAELKSALDQLQRLRLALEAQALPIAPRDIGLATLERDILKLQSALLTAPDVGLGAPEVVPDGLRNHCEGALHRLVEAAAREVLDEAQRRGSRLGLRVTGALDPVDEGLGAALLELLPHLWSDCLEAQSARVEPRIDTVLRGAEHRLVIEIRDDGMGDDGWRAAHNDDDVLGCYPGLRRSRQLVESLHGLVEVEPQDASGCRFRLSLSLSTQRPHASLVRIGRHDVAIASSAVESVYDMAAVRVGQDGAGAFVDVDGTRVPVLHLAFLLGDVGFDELRREHVIVVGSFERRAALFASEARRVVTGRLMSEAQGPWAGTLETGTGVVPMLHVGAVLGRCGSADAVQTPRRRAAARLATPRGTGVVLVVTSVATEGEQVVAALASSGLKVRVVASAEEAWRTLESEPVDLLLCDLRLPEMHAQQIADRRRQTSRYQDVPMLLVLTQSTEQSHLVVQQLGATAWVRSPIDSEALLEIVRSHVLQMS